jgi:hypothetical protein
MSVQAAAFPGRLSFLIKVGQATFVGYVHNINLLGLQSFPTYRVYALLLFK